MIIRVKHGQLLKRRKEVILNKLKLWELMNMFFKEILDFRLFGFERVFLRSKELAKIEHERPLDLDRAPKPEAKVLPNIALTL